MDGSARELLAELEPEDDDDGSAIDDATDFLRDLLAKDPRPVKDIKRAASIDGHAWATVRRAKDRLGVKAIKAGMSGGWRWELTREGAQRMPKVPSTQSGAPSGVDEHLRDSDPSDDGWEPVE